MDYPDWLIVDDPRSPFYEDNNAEDFAEMTDAELSLATKALEEGVQDPEIPKMFRISLEKRLEAAKLERRLRDEC